MLNVISYAVVMLGLVLLAVAGVIAIWGRQTPHGILLYPTLMGGLMLLCFGGAGVGFTSPLSEQSEMCRGCGYDRRGLRAGAACPECGKRES